MPENLWPTEFGEIGLKTPVSILREQAQGLGSRTANVVVGRVQSVGSSGPGRFRYVLYLYSAPLAYSMPLLYVEHGIGLYPVDIGVDGDPNARAPANSPEELIDCLKEIFSREKTKKTIASLIAQSKE
jgi:hypothetical protein